MAENNNTTVKATPAAGPVGYRRPPTGAQFRPGQSGNPEGYDQRAGPIPLTSPKKLNNETFLVRQGNKSRHMPALEAIFLFAGGEGRQRGYGIKLCHYRNFLIHGLHHR